MQWKLRDPPVAAAAAAAAAAQPCSVKKDENVLILTLEMSLYFSPEW